MKVIFCVEKHLYHVKRNHSETFCFVFCLQSEADSSESSVRFSAAEKREKKKPLEVAALLLFPVVWMTHFACLVVGCICLFIFVISD